MTTANVNLGNKIVENERFLKEMAAFQEWLAKEEEKLATRSLSIMYQAHFAILKEHIAFKIGARQIEIKFKLADYPFFADKTSLEIFGTKESEDFAAWLNKNGLAHVIETVEFTEGDEVHSTEVLSIVPAKTAA